MSKIIYELIGGGLDGETITQDEDTLTWEVPIDGFGNYWKYERKSDKHELIFQGVTQ